MNCRKISFLISLLLILALIPSVRATKELARGSLGLVMHYVIKSPIEIKVGEDTPISFMFQNGGSSAIFVRGIWVWIFGAGINETGTGISRLLVKDMELRSLESINETILVKPIREGIIAISIHAEYNFTDFYGNARYDWGEDTIFVYARIITYEDVKNITYILSATTIGFIVVTVYLARKLKLKT